MKGLTIEHKKSALSAQTFLAESEVPMARQKRKWRMYRSHTNCVSAKEAARRIRHYLIMHQTTFHMTGDPNTRESLSAFRVAKDTGLTRERVRLLIYEITINGRPAHDYIVQATVSSPATIALIRTLWQEDPSVTTIKMSTMLREDYGRRVGDNLIRKILRSLRGKTRERRSKRAS